ncbi:MAG: SpoIIE family protein phosphatase, partial [Candidatus Riflebacteria bacterium]|nr:SpoIIE family protein phosphatase [Candidatus Riflebacteria bacterium]
YSYGSKKYENVLYSILEKNPGEYENITGDIVIDNKKYIFAYLTGVNFKDWSILSVYPEEEIDKEINLLLAQILAIAFISLLFTIIIGHLLSIQFLSPINNLGVATLAIGERNFSHRIPIGDKDEFGYLNQMFNRVIEGLGDFEVAKIVQESLFPGNRFSVGNFDIFGRSVVMTTLGGDYYDCFKINDEYQGIIIGDVAGHGIPSGLMMAMAKSSVLSAPEEIKLDPTLLTTRLHKMFFAIKNERLKRMMTFQYFVLNVKTGHFIYTNAGHCFPYIVNNETKTASFLEYIATPLGIGPRCRCKNYEFDLKVGDSLILYTDGIVEAYNEAGEQYGYERFKKSLPDHYNSNPETYYYNLYNKVYKTWSHKPDDDLTIIIVNRN